MSLSNLIEFQKLIERELHSQRRRKVNKVESNGRKVHKKMKIMLFEIVSRFFEKFITALKNLPEQLKFLVFISKQQKNNLFHCKNKNNKQTTN